jgi:hypothetical protein
MRSGGNQSRTRLTPVLNLNRASQLGPSPSVPNDLTVIRYRWRYVESGLALLVYDPDCSNVNKCHC